MRKTILILIVAWLLAFAGTASAQMYVPPQARVFIDEGETADVSGEIEDREVRGDFGMAITAALYKKKVPVIVVTDIEKADFVINHSSTRDEDGTGTKAVKIIFGGGLWGGGVKFEGTFTVVSREESAVAFSYNVKKNNFQSAAEAFAKHFKNHIKDGVKKKKK
jgi:hypothetical protein